MTNFRRVKFSFFRKNNFREFYFHADIKPEFLLTHLPCPASLHPLTICSKGSAFSRTLATY